jgi:hypothetical protein
MRPPKNIADYVSAEDAARALEELAATIRRMIEVRPLVRWSVQLSYWNHDWATRKGDGTILTSLSCRSPKASEAGLPLDVLRAYDSAQHPHRANFVQKSKARRAVSQGPRAPTTG